MYPNFAGPLIGAAIVLVVVALALGALVGHFL
jgi:hypothetical protein